MGCNCSNFGTIGHNDLPPVDVPIKSGSPGLKVNRWDGDGLMGSELHRQRASYAKAS